MMQIYILPAVACQDGPVHRGVQFAQADDVGVGAGGVVEEVVGLREAEVAAEHDLAAVFVIFRPDPRRLGKGALQGLYSPLATRYSPIFFRRKRKGVEAVGRRVADTSVRRLDACFRSHTSCTLDCSRAKW
jgi:hypothetical protein